MKKKTPGSPGTAADTPVRRRALRPKRDGAGPAGVPQVSAPRAGLPEEEPAPQAVVLPQETGKVKLDPSRMAPAEVLSLAERVEPGMMSVQAYAALPVLPDLTAAKAGLNTSMQLIASLEIQLKEARISHGQWVQACGSALQRAAIACESADPAPGTLVSAGWTLRKGRSPAHEMPAPSGLRLRQTAFAGQGVARWKSVKNARYYELQVDPVPGAPITVAESVLLKTVRVDQPLPPMAPGSLVTLCVRAVGVKGPGPFCDALTVRVN